MVIDFCRILIDSDDAVKPAVSGSACFFALVFSVNCVIVVRMKYTEKLAARIAATRSALCVGLDPRPQTENMTELADGLR